jgi:hypothetical protein
MTSLTINADTINTRTVYVNATDPNGKPYTRAEVQRYLENRKVIIRPETFASLTGGQLTTVLSWINTSLNNQRRDPTQ